MKTREGKEIVFVEWLDSKGVTHEWEYLEEIESMKPDKCLSVGFLLEKTKEYLTIAQSVGQTQVIGRTTIPCCSIKRIKKLTV